MHSPRPFWIYAGFDTGAAVVHQVEPPIRDNSPDLTFGRRTKVLSSLLSMWALPDAKSLAHIPERSSPIDPRIVRLAAVMGLPAPQIESDIHAVIARQWSRRGQWLPFDVAIDRYGKTQAVVDGMRGREWPTDCPDCTSFGKCRYCGGTGTYQNETSDLRICQWCGGDGKCPNECERSKT